MKLLNKNVTIAGLGKSGAACARFLRTQGAVVTITDRADEAALADAAEEMRDIGVSLALAGHPPAVFEEADLILLSPGIPHTLAPLERARARGIPVIGEIELASRFITEPIVAVTGTNGKTTTTELLGEMLRRSGLKVFVGGNIGTPLISYAAGADKADLLVAEVSSFQLDTIAHFCPKVGLLLNISEDHLDRYPDFAAYGMSKARLFENQGADDVAILNGADPFVRSIGKNISSRRLWFNPSEKDRAGAFLHDGCLLLRPCEDGQAPVELDLSSLRLTGTHNLENVAAAALAALAAGGTPEGIQAALDRFRGLPHRLEYVDTVDGVRYVDDSKATNVDAVVRALESFDAPVVLIMGGRGKGSDYTVLNDLIRQHTRRLIVMGETAAEIREVLGPRCRGGVREARTMDEAVALARQSALSGDVVLLSPAGSSFDMYRSYARRGEDFCRAVRQLTPPV
ncbi:UDP-N-acetylmuramoyl-L-alanine--D-glutamate liga se [Desulfonema ishimotonii]|uniref:UDP-N-acetylmuramoylalanine--D-glutamate ligase n=1 Tax=Desulfonema ishimotonii TaxID=45657 RepID=A0A401FYF7_9BACT|nr:UDP-N-acetylmuramoyl-L-alanine--D-glutamate ligase [Desulfonema ishimotonii]GBC61983.1 UDP-N-acetylmuramoyl-L-alanine--D-glutamate liga se [Desulfonema ishimotonii]